MESAMRRRLGQRMWKAILWLLLFSLAGTSFIGILYQVFGSGKNQYVLEVNGIKITRADLAYQTQSLQEKIHIIRTQTGEYADFILQQNGLLGQPQAIALDRLVARAVALYGAQKSGIRYISPSYAAEKLDDPNFVFTRLSDILPAYLLQGYGRLNRQSLDEFFRRSPELAARFDALYMATLQEDLFNQILEGVAYIPTVCKLWNKKLAESMRTYGVYALSKSAFTKEAAAEEHEDVLKEFFKQENLHRRYWSEEGRAGTAWRFAPQKYGVIVSDVAMRRYFADRAKTGFKDKKFESVKDEIYTHLLKDQFKKLFSIEAKAYIGANTAAGFAAFAEKKHGAMSKIAPINKSAADSLAARALFSIVREGGRSFFIDEDGSGVIVELNELNPSKEHPFEDVVAMVRSNWVDTQAANKLAAAAEDILKNLQNQEELKKLLQKYHAKTGSTFTASALDQERWEKIEKEKMPVAQMKRMGHPGYGVISQIDQDRLQIVFLSEINTEITENSASQIAADISKENAQELRVMKMVVSKDVLAVLKDSAKIKQYKEEKTTDISSYFAE
ncbi:MAG: hypothetical protein UV79_C0009G0011 [candidate division TM6 bacterium GW2011_GWF2_43_17]|nr:MAG: hypothetical protein UV79_C0009G0011 [candidate division TM6 bacterium GW2011_GWF2_43_17]HAU30390.1 hypothetical protein [Candidatus Dependentiae bacterium]